VREIHTVEAFILKVITVESQLQYFTKHHYFPTRQGEFDETKGKYCIEKTLSIIAIESIVDKSS
jgi:hypothetical protein